MEIKLCSKERDTLYTFLNIQNQPCKDCEPHQCDVAHSQQCGYLILENIKKKLKN